MFYMLVCIITLEFILGISCDSCTNITCPSIPQHYRELGCKPHKNSESDCCATRFECQDFKSLDINKCHYKGRAYEVGDTAPAEFHDACETSCSCKNSPGRPAHFECTDFIECPALKEFHLNYCVQQHKPGVCCPEVKCSQPIKQELGACRLDGETYKTGEIMNPKSFPCYTCVCSDNFDNSTTVADNPECTAVNCGFADTYIHYFQMGCVPLYFQSYGCCTVAFRCPMQTDVIIKSKDVSVAAAPDLQCKFGNSTLNLGDELGSNDPCVSCKCNAPPLLHCIRKTNCFIQAIQKN